VHEYAKTVHAALLAAGTRAEIDMRSEKIGKKIREAEVGKIPCMVIAGQKERDTGEVSLRRHRKGDMGSFSVAALTDMIGKEITERI